MIAPDSEHRHRVALTAASATAARTGVTRMKRYIV